MDYAIIYDENDVICIDRKEGKIKTLKYGQFEDITNQCERMRKSKTKSDRQGADWHRMLTNDKTKHHWHIEKIETDSAEEYFGSLVKLQIKQVENLLRVVREHNNWREPYVMGYNG